MISLILSLAVLGFVCWIILQIPMPAHISRIIIGVVCLFIIVCVLQELGFVGNHFWRFRLR